MWVHMRNHLLPKHTLLINSLYTQFVNVNVITVYNAAHQNAEENPGLSLWFMQSESSGDILSTHTQGHYISIDCPVVHPVVTQKNGGRQIKLCFIPLSFNPSV